MGTKGEKGTSSSEEQKVQPLKESTKQEPTIVEKIVEVQKEIDLSKLKKAGKLVSTLAMDLTIAERKETVNEAKGLLLEFIKENQ